MTNAAHTHQNHNNSLQAKVKAWHRASQEYRNIKRSQSLISNPVWGDRLGEEQDLKAAKTILKNSLNIASQSLKTSDLQEAEVKGLLSTSEVRNIIILQRRAETQRNQQDNTRDNSRSRGR